MCRYVDVLSVATLLLSGCVAQLQSISSGAIGCPPDEISIEDKVIGYSTVSWTAECRGQRFYCSALSSQHSTMANCRPEVAPTTTTRALSRAEEQRRVALARQMGVSATPPASQVRPTSVAPATAPPAAAPLSPQDLAEEAAAVAVLKDRPAGAGPAPGPGVCLEYLKQRPTHLGLFVSTFGQNGWCWQGDAPRAERCARQCAQLLDPASRE